MPEMKTPGVYIVEQNAFPVSIVQAATAVPAFVGHTATAQGPGVPVRITSLAEYVQHFSGPPAPRFRLVDTPPAGNDPAPVIGVSAGNQSLTVVQTSPAYRLFAAMRHFFVNGGGACHVVSVGGYDDAPDPDHLIGGIEALRDQDEPTMLVIPESTALPRAGAAMVTQAMLAHCGEVRQDRMAILDIHGGFRGLGGADDPVAAFRADAGTHGLSYGAAYYPWLETTLFAASEFTFGNLEPDARDVLAGLLQQDGGPDVADALADAAEDPAAAKALDHELRTTFPLYAELMQAMCRQQNILPPGAAMAGIWTSTDYARGVWKAPAGVPVSAVAKLVEAITDQQQEGLNAPADGKAVNAIRTFTGRGTRVWGARTLAGISSEWRHVPVRRTQIMIRTSLHEGLKAFVFEPNTRETWIAARDMVTGFLYGLWTAGAFPGSRPDDAFFVRCGLGETMTQTDIDNGVMIVEVGFAPVRPAEFVILRIRQVTQTPP